MLFLLSKSKFSTFSTFYKIIIFFINLLDLYNRFLGSYWIRSVQNGSKWIKLDQIGVFTNQKFYYKKLLSIYLPLIIIKWWFVSDQIWSDLSKLDQTWSNLIKLDQTWSKFHILQNPNHQSTCPKWWFVSDQIQSDLSKLDQIGSNLIKLAQSSTFYKILIINLLAQNN